MAHIKSRKHTNTALNRKLGAAFAVLMLPAVSHAQAQTQGQTQEQTLPAVNVKAAKEQTYKAESASSPKYSQPLVDTPQTITVIRKEVMAEQGAVTLTDALRNTPGVGTFFLGENGSTSTGDAIYMRGFDTSSSIYVDNVRDLGSISRDMFNIEQVEVLKGPAGTDNGRGAPTGSINLVTKQPGKEDTFAASVAVGTGQVKRSTVDWNKVIDAEKGVAFRLNAVVQDSGVPGRDEVKNKRWAIAPTLAFGLGSPTRVFLDYLHVTQNNVPDGGVPTIGLPGYTSPDPLRPFLANAGTVNSKNYYGMSSDYDEVTADMLTARVEHDFSADTKLQNTTRFGRTAQDYRLTSFMSTAANFLTPVATNPATWSVARSNPNFKDQVNEIVTNQTNITTKFDTGSIGHTVVGGVEFTKDRQANITALQIGTLPAANLYNPDPNAATPGFGQSTNGTGTVGETKTASAYLFDTLKLSEQWQITGGVRVDHYTTDFADSFLCGASRRPTCATLALPANALTTANLSTSGNLFNWKLAGVFKPTANSSIYALYATSQQPPGGANFSLVGSSNNLTPTTSAGNPAYAPQKTKTAEIGTKWDVLDKQLALTAAVYRTKVNNEVELDSTTGQYFQTGEKQVDGIELGAVGNLTKDWTLSAGYTIMNTKVLSGATVNADGSRNLAYTPRQSFTSWTTYQLPFGILVGGGARFVDTLKRGTDGAIGTPAFANSYWVFDAMVSYKVNKNLDLQLNLYNLADKQYVAAINKSGYRYTPGIERSALLTANYKF